MNITTLHNALISKMYSFRKINANTFQRAISTSQEPHTVFLEKCLKNPVIVVPKETKVDLIGPPNPVSNLRPVIRQVLLHETPLQQRLREFQNETQRWNETFWTAHNTKFATERNEYVRLRTNLAEEKRTLTAEEMSEFYKSFLDRNWKTHFEYNLEWYKRNFMMLLLSLRVNIENVLQRS